MEKDDLQTILVNSINNDPTLNLLAKTGIIIFILFLIIVLVIILIRYFKGDKIKLGFIECTKDGRYQELDNTLQRLTGQFEGLNAIAEQKSQILKLYDNWIVQIGKMVTISDKKEFEIFKEKFYNFILQGIIEHITKDRNNCHRASILVPDTNRENLINLYEQGFSPGYKIMLPIKKSIAGKVYCMERPYYSSNVEKDPDFHIDINSERKILSISCCPIKRNDITVAVLSLDGIKEESFDPDERAYLENCANIIGLIMQAEDIHENFLIIQYERGLGNEKQNDQNKSA